MMNLFSSHGLKPVCEFLAAMCTLIAAVCWLKAARAPIGTSGPSPYMPADRAHPLWKEMEAHGQRIARGATWNQRAAVASVFAALFAFAASYLG